MSNTIHIISLGAGVQSSTMALMAAHGEITPMPTCAIFADTQAEPKSVYTWLDWLEKQLPFPVHRVTKGSLAEAALAVRISKGGNSYTNSNIPAFLKTEGVARAGLQIRQCTKDFKIDALLREARRIIGKERMSAWRKQHREALRSISQHEKVMRAAGVAARGRAEEREECQDDPLLIQWIGISRDEVSRMKPSRLLYIEHRWPLIDQNITRTGCVDWMKRNGYPEPPRSACVFCPYHGDKEWLRLKDLEPEEFERAAQFEDDYQVSLSQIQRRQAVPFLHRSMLPLRTIDFATLVKNKADKEAQQPSLFGNECEGMCGV